MAKKQNVEVFSAEEQQEFEVELKKEKKQTVNEELFAMIKKLEAMHARCGQIQKEGVGTKFPFVVQMNLKSCISRINMFAKNVS